MSTVTSLEYDFSLETLEKGMEFLEVNQPKEILYSFNPDQAYEELIQQFSYPQAPVDFRFRLRRNLTLWREIRKLEEQLDRVWVQFKNSSALKENLQNLMAQLKETLAKGLEFVKG